MSDDTEVTIACVAGFVVGLLIGLMGGFTIVAGKIEGMKEEAVKRKAAEYNPETGIWRWKAVRE